MRFITDKLTKIRSKNDVIGLDIGYSSIKYVVLQLREDKSRPYVLKNYGIETIPCSAAENSTVKSELRLANVIKELLEKAATYSKFCVTALPDTLVSCKWIRVDCAATESIELAIDLAIEKHIPYPLDAIYYDYQIFDNQQHEDINQRDVLLVACRKEHLDARLDMLCGANLTPLFIEVNSHAIERAYGHFYAAHSMQSDLLIDVGTAQLTILFLDQRKQWRSYSERMTFYNNETVLQQIQRAINGIFLSYPYYKWHKLFFIGSNLPLLDFLAKKMPCFFGVKTATLAWDNALFTLNSLDEQKIKTLYPSLFLSLGLALRGL